MALQRMKIQPFKDAKLSQMAGNAYMVTINPEKYSLGMRVNYSDQAAPGSSNTTVVFGNMPPSTLSFELVFDATGAIPDSPPDLAVEIGRFMKVVYKFQGAIHQPYYLRLTWGKLNYTARLSALDFQYTLFSPTGAPLRARANASFINFVPPVTIEGDADKRSSDLTHVRTVKQGETLIGIARDVYGDPSMYVKLARANALPSTRQLKPGSRLICPPTI